VVRTGSILTSFAVLAGSAAQLFAADQQEIGSTVKVVNLVTAEYNRDTRSLQRGDRVHQDEFIYVGSDGSSELKLDDNTKLALGAGSELKLDKFVYDPGRPKGAIVIEMVKGTFRFITGVAEKPAYTIKTPSAAISVRGTIFDVFVKEDGQSWVLLHEGGVQACNSAKSQCKEHGERGKLVSVTRDGSVSAPVTWSAFAGKGNMSFDDVFPFVGKPPSIDPLMRKAEDDDEIENKSKPKKAVKKAAKRALAPLEKLMQEAEDLETEADALDDLE